MTTIKINIQATTPKRKPGIGKEEAQSMEKQLKGKQTNFDFVKATKEYFKNDPIKMKKEWDA